MRTSLEMLSCVVMKASFLALASLCVGLLKSNALDFSTVEFAGGRFTICRVEVNKDRLQLFHRDEQGRPFKRFNVLESWLATRGHRLSFAMNAGMYHADYSAVGLYVSGGVQSSPLNLAEAEGNFFLKPNGVFALTDRGAVVVESSQYQRLPGQVILASQSGPLLVQRGVIHPAFRPGSTSRLRRNGVGVPSPEIALFVISEGPVNFHDFATLFRDRLKCPDALFFDGTVSSLHAPALKRSDFRMNLGPILGVTE